MSAVELRDEGTRVYLLGNTYPVKEQIKGLGGHWDGDRKAWWVGAAKREQARALVAQIAATSVGNTPVPERASEALDENAPLVGKAQYRGKLYLLVWEGTTSRGRACKLAFRDGSKVFWADAAAVTVVKRYLQPERGNARGFGRRDGVTLRSLRAFAERRKREEATGECECRCHREPNAGQPGSTLYDGCDRCGCEAC